MSSNPENSTHRKFDKKKRKTGKAMRMTPE
jgi:hypothetical protein